MGLLGAYVVYRIGKGRGERKASTRNQQGGARDGKWDERCNHYNYCVAREICDGLCEYDEDDNER